MNLRYLPIIVLSLAFNSKAAEIELSTPNATFESCTFYQYEDIPLDFALTTLRSCYTRQGKIALFAHLFLGVAFLEAFDQEEREPSKLDEIYSEDNPEEYLHSLDDQKLNSLILMLMEYSNEYHRPEVRIKKKITDVTYIDNLAVGTLVSLNPIRTEQYKYIFKHTKTGWLIHDVQHPE